MANHNYPVPTYEESINSNDLPPSYESITKRRKFGKYLWQGCKYIGIGFVVIVAFPVLVIVCCKYCTTGFYDACEHDLR